MIIYDTNESFDTIQSNIGCKQGGSLSPKLYSIYVEDIIEQINNDSAAAKFYDIPIGIMMYADDMILLSNTRDGLQQLINKVEVFCDDKRIKINGDKSQYIIFTNKRKLPEDTVMIKNKTLKNEDNIKYLGCMINWKLKNRDHLYSRHQQMRGAMYNIQVIGAKNKEMGVKTKIFIYNVYCKPVLLYGCETLFLNKTELEKETKIQNCAIKTMLGLNWRTKSKDIMVALNVEDVLNCHRKAKISFIRNLYRNDLTKNMISKYENEFKQSNNISNKLKGTWLANIMKESKVQTFDPVKIIENISTEMNENNKIKQDKKKSDIVRTLTSCFDYYTSVNKLLVESLIRVEFYTKGGAG